MALLTRREFAELCGMKPNALNVYIQRKKVLLSGDYVDNLIEPNKSFVEKRIAQGKVKKEEVPTEQKGPNVNVKEPEYEIPKKPNVGSPATKDKANNYMEVELEYKQRQIERLKVQTNIDEIKEAKMRGELIPIDIVENLFAQFSQSIATEFKNGLDSYLTILAKKTGMKNKEVAESRADLIHVINDSVNKAVDNSQKSIQSVIDDMK